MQGRWLPVVTAIGPVGALSGKACRRRQQRAGFQSSERLRMRQYAMSRVTLFKGVCPVDVTLGAANSPRSGRRADRTSRGVGTACHAPVTSAVVRSTVNRALRRSHARCPSCMWGNRPLEAPWSSDARQPRPSHQFTRRPRLGGARQRRVRAMAGHDHLDRSWTWAPRPDRGSRCLRSRGAQERTGRVGPRRVRRPVAGDSP